MSLWFMNFAVEIIKWYQEHKRDLPWRNTRDPYIIWLSEIIMQQTRVEQGLPYFERFAEKYPTVRHFAEAEEGEILKQWQGLGYYSRGRNMHKTAKVVMEDYAGYFPSSYHKLIKLKGIGEYTAAAISSFAADEKRAVVDGNVFRLLARFYGIELPVNSTAGKKYFSLLAAEVLDTNQPATFNQAIMEFGALQCKPKNPLCETCPLRVECVAFNTGKIQVLPQKLKSKPSKSRYFNYFLYRPEGRILISRRGPNDIWENLYELPLIETPIATDALQIVQSDEYKLKFGPKSLVTRVFPPVKHVLSHQNIYAQFIELENFPEQLANDSGWIMVDINELENFAQPKLIFHFINNLPKLINNF